MSDPRNTIWALRSRFVRMEQGQQCGLVVAEVGHVERLLGRSVSEDEAVSIKALFGAYRTLEIVRR